MEKLEYSSYYAIIKYEWVHNSTYGLSFVYYTNGSHEVLLSFVCWSFQVLSMIMMDEGIRSDKSLSLGIPEAPQNNI
jgi:hypothetical protein